MKPTTFLLLLSAGLPACATKSVPEDLDLAGRIQPVSSNNILREEGFYVWGASVIQGDDGRYHMFYARWPEGMVGRDPDDPKDKRFEGMNGWLKYSEIAYATADSFAGPYVHRSTVLRGSGVPGNWDRFTAHNPHIKKFGGRYYLYYVANHRVQDKDLWYSHVGGQCIGVLVADSIADLVAGRWDRPKKPLMCPDGKATFHRAVNPSVTRGQDGRFYMMFKSYSTKNGRGGHMTHWMAVAEEPAGPFHLAGNVFDSAEFAAEDPYLWYDPRRRRFYAIVKNFKRDGALARQRGALALITSKDGVRDWRPATHRLVSNRHYFDGQGKEHTLGHMERPQLLIDAQGRIRCLYVAASYGNPWKGFATFNLHLPVRPERCR